MTTGATKPTDVSNRRVRHGEGTLRAARGRSAGEAIVARGGTVVRRVRPEQARSTCRQARCRLPKHATMPTPQTRYAKSGDVNVAYQVLGEGPLDLVYVWGWLSHLDLQWTEPTVASFLQRLASFSRLIMFDKRGTGLSDPVGAAPTFEERMDDIRAVMDAVGSERAALLGFSEGSALSCLFAASYPERTTGLILYDSFVVGLDIEDAPRDLTRGVHALEVRETIERWGEGRRCDGSRRRSPRAAWRSASGACSSGPR